MMRFGLNEKTIEGIQSVLARYPAVDKAVLYGSRAKGNFRVGSDIDLTLCGDAITEPELARIAEDIDDLLLPYTVDLSLYSQLRHPGLRAHIERVGVVFYHREEA